MKEKDEMKNAKLGVYGVGSCVCSQVGNPSADLNGNDERAYAGRYQALNHEEDYPDDYGENKEEAGCNAVKSSPAEYSAYDNYYHRYRRSGGIKSYIDKTENDNSGCYGYKHSTQRRSEKVFH